MRCGIVKLVSREHFNIDDTLLEACVSMKALRAKDGSEEAHQRGLRIENRLRRQSVAQGRKQRNEVVRHVPYRHRESKRRDRWHSLRSPVRNP